MNQDNAPFYIGQKVVCTDTINNQHRDCRFVKDEIYFVTDQWQCGKCKRWFIGVGRPIPGSDRFAGCFSCSVRTEFVNVLVPAKFFAPIIEGDNTNAEISESLIDQARDLADHKETIVNPEKVLN